jgi:rRNA maturation endonuclease Nob1
VGEKERVIIRCTECESLYTGWSWPERPPQIIGKEQCPSCGSQEFVAVDEASAE